MIVEAQAIFWQRLQCGVHTQPALHCIFNHCAKRNHRAPRRSRITIMRGRLSSCPNAPFKPRRLHEPVGRGVVLRKVIRQMFSKDVFGYGTRAPAAVSSSHTTQTGCNIIVEPSTVKRRACFSSMSTKCACRRSNSSSFHSRDMHTASHCVAAKRTQGGQPTLQRANCAAQSVSLATSSSLPLSSSSRTWQI